MKWRKDVCLGVVVFKSTNAVWPEPPSFYKNHNSER